MSKDEAMQAFRAAILSDGGLQLSRGKGEAYFHVTLSDNKKTLVQRELIPIGELLRFLQRFVIEVLEPLGVEPQCGHPRLAPHFSKNKEGEWIPGVILFTRTSVFLTELYHEYYPDGKKAVPENFALTDLFLAYFFMFDGTSMWNSSGGPGVDVCLCTQGFDFHSVELLERQLHKLDISTGRGRDGRVKKGAGIIINILTDSTDYFTSIIDPRVIPPYRYKVKYRGSCPPELARKYRNDRREYRKEYMRGYTREYRGKKEEERTIARIQSIRSIIGKGRLDAE